MDQAKNLAEVAFSVTRDWQGKGLSSIILSKLAKAAQEHGISGLVAYTSPQNQNMIKLFRKLPYKVSAAIEDEFLVLTARFSEPLDNPETDSRTPSPHIS